jgi:hypothetical protein
MVRIKDTRHKVAEMKDRGKKEMIKGYYDTNSGTLGSFPQFCSQK